MNMDAHTDSPKTECLQHGSNGGGGITKLIYQQALGKVTIKSRRQPQHVSTTVRVKKVAALKLFTIFSLRLSLFL